MEDFAIHIIDSYGYFGILILTALESIFPVIPAEFILTLGGVATTVTQVTRAGVILSATMGELTGALALYSFGRFFSEEKLRKTAEKRGGKILGIKIKDIEKTKEWFLKKGKYTVLFSKCIPVIGSLIAIPAGMANMNLVLFILFSLIGILIWNSVLVMFGVTLKESFDILVSNSQSSLFLKAFAVLFIACFIIVVVSVIRDQLVKKKEETQK